MKQVLQHIRSGQLSVQDIPAPLAQPGEVLIANEASIVSAGTEKMIMELAKKSLLGKARERPDHLKRVLQKIKQDGLLPTLRAVRAKLDEPMTMGYASAGTVLAVGEGVSGFQVGDRVASNGPHAEVVSVPKNLCAKVPAGVPMSHAAFAVLGSIALQGIRLSKATLGERVFVIGLGLIGQLTVSILRSAGCRVIATDLDESKCQLALEMGAAEARTGLSAAQVQQWADGVGADAVLITASTKSNGPITLAADAVRQKGRVVLVGVVGLELDRRPFYFKEAEFVVSCSYGPGRYDPQYEDKGHDYPIGYVRWTEQRNLQAVLELMRNDGLRLDKLISHRFPIERGTDAYELIESGKEPYLGILLEYALPETETEERRSPTLAIKVKGRKDGKIGIGFLGAGNFASSVLIPTAVKTPGFKPIGICSAGGVSAAHAARKHGFPLATTNEDEIFEHPEIDAIFIATRHNLHARQVIRALEQGKHVYVEKPLCLTLEELAAIDTAYTAAHTTGVQAMVGFNRRYSPHLVKARELIRASAAPIALYYRFNAGPLPDEHWLNDPKIGGGRIIGEACHAIDAALYLTGSSARSWTCTTIPRETSAPIAMDNCVLTIEHTDGSISTISYQVAGPRSLPKERIDIVGSGLGLDVDDFVTTRHYSPRATKKPIAGKNKGHSQAIASYASAISSSTEEFATAWQDAEKSTELSVCAAQHPDITETHALTLARLEQRLRLPETSAVEK